MQSQIFIVCCNVQEYSRLFNVFTVPLLLSFFSWITVNTQKIYKTKNIYIYITIKIFHVKLYSVQLRKYSPP